MSRRSSQPQQPVVGRGLSGSQRRPPPPVQPVPSGPPFFEGRLRSKEECLIILAGDTLYGLGIQPTFKRTRRGTKPVSPSSANVSDVTDHRWTYHNLEDGSRSGAAAVQVSQIASGIAQNIGQRISAFTSAIRQPAAQVKVHVPRELLEGHPAELHFWERTEATQMRAVFDLLKNSGSNLVVVENKDYATYLNPPPGLRPSADMFRHLPDRAFVPNFSGLRDDADPQALRRTEGQLPQLLWGRRPFNIFDTQGFYHTLKSFLGFRGYGAPQDDGNEYNEASVERLVGTAFYAPHATIHCSISSNEDMAYPELMTALGGNGAPDFWSWRAPKLHQEEDDIASPPPVNREDVGELATAEEVRYTKGFRLTTLVSDCKLREEAPLVVWAQLASYMHAPLNLIIMAIRSDADFEAEYKANRLPLIPKWAYILGTICTERSVDFFAFYPRYEVERERDGTTYMSWSYVCLRLASLEIKRVGREAVDQICHSIALTAALLRMRRHSVELSKALANLRIPPELLRSTEVRIEKYPAEPTLPLEKQMRKRIQHYLADELQLWQDE